MSTEHSAENAQFGPTPGKHRDDCAWTVYRHTCSCEYLRYIAALDYIIEWREQLGVEVMRLMRCTHVGDDFGSRAVCETCFDNTQRIGVLVQHLAAVAWDKGRAAERRDWELTANLSTPDEDRHPLPNPYRLTPAVREGTR